MIWRTVSRTCTEGWKTNPHISVQTRFRSCHSWQEGSFTSSKDVPNTWKANLSMGPLVTLFKNSVPCKTCEEALVELWNWNWFNIWFIFIYGHYQHLNLMICVMRFVRRWNFIAGKENIHLIHTKEVVLDLRSVKRSLEVQNLSCFTFCGSGRNHDPPLSKLLRYYIFTIEFSESY